MSSNYYDLLGVSRSDSYSKVRHSYRDLVKKHHPDVSDLPNAQERFQQVKAAYEVLNHPKKREKYNQISHNEFVSQHGGYTSEEIKKVTEVQLVSKRRRDSQSSSSRSQGRNQVNQTGHEVNEERNSTSRNSSYNWILQGRTANKSGYAAYAIRLPAYFALTFVVLLSLRPVLGTGDSAFYFPAGVLLSRAIYLLSFEYLRKGYVKIDDSPEPDAYSIPSAVGLGVFGFLLLSLAIVISYAPSGTVIISLLLIVGFPLFGYGLIGTVLAVGWGAADDHYNLRLNVRPAFWNFLVQAPILTAVAIPNLSSKAPAYLLALLLTPLLVGTIYTAIYHNEIGGEIISRLTD